MTDLCIFCQITAKNLPSHMVWEDENFYAFLDIYPNTDGVTLVVPKKHYASYLFEVPAEVISALLLATRTVAQMLDKAFTDSSRCALVFEGLGVDHLHAKLYPLHGTRDLGWKAKISSEKKYFPVYEGYFSTQEGKQANGNELEALAARVRTV